ncbi:MAG: hypothetical protein NC180_13215 [Muribaculaceae bacterium]|nr:hypothetical protein [Acetatifactor muris]MCM1494162.1 hypothetical protein [Muribaculaceae bacterium]MCM1559184.1 hypothetical protein [Butyrivibrio sp.]
MGKMIFNGMTMQDYLADFDVLRHKFLYTKAPGETVSVSVLEELLKNFYPGEDGRWDMDRAVETFLTVDKVYHYGSARDTENTNILELVTEKFLREYVNIDGLEELFQSSYFYFEWMMHLEYKEQQHDYSYYRDHYLHQVRNLYEMFMFLDQDELWRTCMDIYSRENSRVAVEMQRSVREQREKTTIRKWDCLKEIMYDDEGVSECCYHYIIFATAAVSSLVHDIGYPVVYMRRNMARMQSFLPMSHIFMDAGNCMPHVKSLLSNSLLFSTVPEEEIRKRLEDSDHGAYSAIILLMQYYDNGRIFSLEPVKRMVLELSALVIYNHTLKYEFQAKKKYDRYHSVFTENPISYLFRLCDDLQEWERVYFLISDKSAFFVCDKCKTPMIRRRNEGHVYAYSCVCGAKGWNSLWFPNRRMINVAPFTELEIACVEKTEKEKRGRWILDLKCDRKALLQLARYNDTFALQRLRGIRELREMAKKQERVPDIYVRAFLTNNPVAVKVKILEEFAAASGREKDISAVIAEPVDLGKKLVYLWDERKFLEKSTAFLTLKNRIEKKKCRKSFYDILISKISPNYSELTCRTPDGTMKMQTTTETKRLLLQSLDFYLYLLILGRMACKKKLAFSVEGEKEEKGKKYEEELSVYCEQLAKMTAQVWNIRDKNMIALMADCFALMHCDFSSEESFWEEDTYRYEVHYPLRGDICEVVQSYTEERDYLTICEKRKRKRDTGEMVFDFYSDYFLYFIMDICIDEIM